jgi:hypothetical protein
MVEALKRSVDGLEPPTCPGCDLPMLWYRAERRQPELISHYFHCSACSKVGEVKTSFRTRKPLDEPPRFFRMEERPHL